MANPSGVPAFDQERDISKTKIWQVIGASSAGTVIEWYDFYIFGSLAAVISPLFYPKGNDTLALIAYLSTFAVGFIVRPFGALFFGRIGDLVGRKYTFLVTMGIMGLSTFAVGLLPSYAAAGVAAPLLLVALRLLQGLRDRFYRIFADLRNHRHSCAGCADPDPHPARAGIGRRIRRRGGLCCRTRP